MGLTWVLGIFLLLLMPRVDTCEEEVTLQRGTVEGWGKQNWKPLCLLDCRVLMDFVLNFIFKTAKSVVYIGEKSPTATGENTGGFGAEGMCFLYLRKGLLNFPHCVCLCSVQGLVSCSPPLWARPRGCSPHRAAEGHLQPHPWAWDGGGSRPAPGALPQNPHSHSSRSQKQTLTGFSVSVWDFQPDFPSKSGCVITLSVNSPLSLSKDRFKPAWWFSTMLDKAEKVSKVAEAPRNCVK